MQTDAKHQEHDADLGKLRGQTDIRDKARGRRPDQDAAKQVADQRRNSDSFADDPENQGGAEGRGNGCNERNIVFHERLHLYSNVSMSDREFDRRLPNQED